MQYLFQLVGDLITAGEILSNRAAEAMVGVTQGMTPTDQKQGFDITQEYSGVHLRQD